MDTFELDLLILGLKGKSLLDYTNLFSPNEYQKKDKIIIKYFQWFEKVKMKKRYCVKCNKYWKFKKRKISYSFDKTLVSSIICDKCYSKDEKYLKKKNQLR